MTINAKDLLAQLKDEFSQHHATAMQNLALVYKLFPLYAETVQDLADSETQYAELTYKYTKAPAVGTAHLGLPGISFTPQIDMNGMRTDTATLEQLGPSIQELRHQKDLVVDQLSRCLQMVQDSLGHEIDSERQLFMLLEEGLRLTTKDGTVGATNVPIQFAR